MRKSEALVECLTSVLCNVALFWLGFHSLRLFIGGSSQNKKNVLLGIWNVWIQFDQYDKYDKYDKYDQYDQCPWKSSLTLLTWR